MEFNKNIIIMDNGGSHKSSKVRTVIKDSKNTLYTLFHIVQKLMQLKFFYQLKHHFDFENKKVTFINLKLYLKSIRKI